MFTKQKLIWLSLLLAFVTLATAVRDPELEQCQHQCGKQRGYTESEVQKCQDKCEQYYKEKQKREEEKGQGGSNREDPLQKFQECEEKCAQKHDEKEWGQCHEKCQKEFREAEKKEKEKGGRGSGDMNIRGEEGEQQEQSEKEREGEPYIFQDQHFTSKVQTEHGKLRILQRFNERSELLQGIKNFRLAIFEANPQTFALPNHWDADTVFFVHQGRGAISLIREDKRESFNIRRGDVMRIEAGTTVYLVNSDNKEKLVMVKFILPVSTPGWFEAFFGPGGENPQSFFKVFSPELLEAAWNMKKEKFQKFFQHQKEGFLVKASEEQIRALSHHEEGGIWPFGGESKGPFNIFKQGPLHSNQHGQYFQVDSSKCQDLRELDLGVGFLNLSRSSMTAPMYHSRAIKIGVVVNGKGRIQIACPHLSSSGSSHRQEGQEGRQSQEGQQGRQSQEGQEGSQSQEGQEGSGSSRQSQTTPSYQRVSGNLECGTVFVIPTAHPFIIVGSQNENLQVILFEVNAFNNERFVLAGRKNIFSFFEKEAKVLSFGASEQEVDAVFIKGQKEEFFFKGPTQQHEGRSYA